MAYSPPTIGLAGLSISSFLDYLNYLLSQLRAIYGAAIYLGTDSADYQDASIRALQAYDVASALQQLYLAMSPGTAIGPSLDLLGQLIGTARKPASFSIATVTVTGTAGVIITNGVVQDTTGNYWNLPSSVTIGGGGTVNVTATAQQIGNITANIGVISIISTPTAGWTSVTNAAAASPGQPVEPDSQYRARLLISQAIPSITLLAGTAAAIAQLSGVTRSQVYENPTNVTDVNGNPPHSITCVVEGGISTAIAQAIYNNKGIGCYTNGTTSVVVTDPNNGGISETISYIVLLYLPIAVGVYCHPLAGFTSATQTAIQTAIVTYLNSLGIGNAVLWSELIAAAMSVQTNPQQPTFAITALSDGYQSAQTTATLNGTTTIVVANAAGIAPGQQVVGSGIPYGVLGTTVVSVTGLNIVITNAATATASGVTVSFFTIVAVGATIPVAFDYAAQGLAANVNVSLV